MSRDRDKKDLTIPGTGALEMELNRVRYQERYMKVIRSTVYSLITVAAVAVLVATLWMPVLQIYGSSMTPTLEDGEIVVSVKSKSFKQGEIIAFYYNNKILIKRVIAVSGDWVNIEENGTVFVNGEELVEPYISEKAYGDTNIEFPYQVPESKIFVMGDHRDVSADSRNTAVGNISQEQILGKIVFRIWPLKSFGRFE
jgi:signal peptidase I